MGQDSRASNDCQLVERWRHGNEDNCGCNQCLVAGGALTSHAEPCVNAHFLEDE